MFSRRRRIIRRAPSDPRRTCHRRRWRCLSVTTTNNVINAIIAFVIIITLLLRQPPPYPGGEVPDAMSVQSARSLLPSVVFWHNTCRWLGGLEVHAPLVARSLRAVDVSSAVFFVPKQRVEVLHGPPRFLQQEGVVASSQPGAFAISAIVLAVFVQRGAHLRG